MKDISPALRRRLQLFALNHFLTGFVLLYSIDKVFQASVGISSFGTALIAVTYTIVGVLLNIPTGILADRWSRKKVVLCANGFLAASSLVIGSANGLALYIIGNIFWGIFYTANNGAQDAFVYDTLAEEGKGQLFPRVDGRNTAFYWSGLMAAGLVSASLTTLLSLRTIILLGIIPSLVNIGVVALIREPAYHKPQKEIKHRHLVKDSLRILHQKRETRLLVTVLVVLSLYGWTANEFSGLLFIAAGFGAYGVSILEAVKSGVTALSAWFAHRYSAQRSLWPLFAACVALLGLSAAGNQLIVPVSFLGFIGLRSLARVVGEARLHDSVPSSIRATAFSTYSQIVDVVRIPLYLVFGIVATRWNVQAGFMFTLVAGLAVLCTGALWKRPSPIKANSSSL